MLLMSELILIELKAERIISLICGPNSPELTRFKDREIRVETRGNRANFSLSLIPRDEMLSVTQRRKQTRTFNKQSLPGFPAAYDRELRIINHRLAQQIEGSVLTRNPDEPCLWHIGSKVGPEQNPKDCIERPQSFTTLLLTTAFPGHILNNIIHRITIDVADYMTGDFCFTMTVHTGHETAISRTIVPV